MERLSNTLGLLRQRKFLPLFLVQLLGAFNDNVIRAAIVTIITYHSAELSDFARTLLVTLSLALFMLPYIFFSALGGQLADKFNKAKLIRYVKFLSIFITALGVIGFYNHSYTLMLLSIFLTGLDSTLFGPTKYSILPDHLEKKELLIANGLIEAGTFIAILFGMLLGSALISHTDSSVSNLSFAIMIVAAVGFVFSLYIPDTESAAKNLSLSTNIIQEIRYSLEYAKKDKDVFLAILGISWFWLIGGVFIAQMPNFTKDTLGSDNSVFLLLLTAFTIGTALGSVFCNRLLKGQIDVQYVPLSMLFMTIFMFVLWYLSGAFIQKDSISGIHYFLSKPAGLGILLSVFAISVFGGIYIVPLYALLLVRTKKSHRSRVIGANNFMNAIFMVSASVICMGLLSINVSVSNLILILTTTNFITTIYISRILPDNIVKGIFQMLFRLIYRVEIIGMENFYKAGDKVLIIANHASFLDPPILGAFLPKRLVFAIDTYQAKSWWISPFLTYLRAYPIDPTNPMATKTLIEKLKDNNPVVIFPEGRITITGSLMKIYEGPALVADKAGAKLLPIRLDGPQYTPFARTHGKMQFKLFPKITITIMEPQTIDVDPNAIGRQRRLLLGQGLYDIMIKTMFEGSEYKVTLFESLLDATKLYGANLPILEDADHNSLTYKRIIQGSFVLAGKMKRYTKLKENVGVFLPNAAGAVVVFFALQVSGRIPAMLNYSTGPKNILACCKAAEIETIFTSKRFIEKADLHHIIEALIKEGLNVIFLEDIRKEVGVRDKIKAFVRSFYPKSHYYSFLPKGEKPKSSDPAAILFTSGSEGVPKGVVLSHVNIQSNIKQAASKIAFSRSDKVFNAMPIFHSFGLTCGFLFPIISGVRVYLYPSPLHYRIIPEMVYGSNCTILFGTDTFLTGYAKYAHPYDFFLVRYIFAGAEKLRAETRKTYMEKFGIRILEGYGVTEASPVVSINTPMHYKSGSVGMLLPSISYHIEPVQGINEGGKLVISGPNIMLGYLKYDAPGILQRPEFMIDGKLRKGWYDTGDIVSVDNDGYITILGREKRFAKIAGEMISLAVIEENLSDLNDETVVAAINIPDDKKGELIILFTNNEDLTREGIHAHFKKIGLSELHVPRIVKYTKEIPLLATGKVDYVSLKEQALADIKSEIAKLKDLTEED